MGSEAAVPSSEKLPSQPHHSGAPEDDRPGAAAHAPGRLLAAHAVYVASALLLMPFVRIEGPAVFGLTPVFATTVLITELATSYLLFVQFTASRTWSLLTLASAYLFTALMAAVHLMTFPGAVFRDRVLLGVPGSAAWAFLFWMTGYAALTFAAVVLEAVSADRRIEAAKIERTRGIAVAMVLGLALACVLAVTIWVDRLPSLMQGTAWTEVNIWITCAAMALILASIALILIFSGGRSRILAWLSLALTALLFANILSLAGGGRYTIGWSLGRLSWMVSASVLFLFFMREFARQQRSLSRARDILEQRVQERTAELSRTVRQRNLLLREVHHRVKNNLQMTDSLIDMESRRIEDPRARESLSALRNRVYSLGLVHQQLMTSDDFETFSIAPFLEELSDNLADSFGGPENGVAVLVVAEPVWVDLEFAIPVGLITTELVTNAMKHARAQQVTVEFRRSGDDALSLVVSDDDPAAAERHRGAKQGTGTRIVEGLVRQLGGRMEVSHATGTRIEIVVPAKEATMS
jgi:two-component sensor histidine kinase